LFDSFFLYMRPDKARTSRTLVRVTLLIGTSPPHIHLHEHGRSYSPLLLSWELTAGTQTPIAFGNIEITTMATIMLTEWYTYNSSSITIHKSRFGVFLIYFIDLARRWSFCTSLSYNNPIPCCH
jgi:hypothetical protein